MKENYRIISIIIPFSVIISLLCISCAPSRYYQVCQVSTDNKIIFNDSLFGYEDDNCRIDYDLWGEGGRVCFSVFNKTDENLFLDLGSSFFVLNGEAYDYYKNQYVLKGTYLSVKDFSKSSPDSPVICIPPQALKRISKFPICYGLIRSCDLQIYPKKEELSSMTFDIGESPFVFRNILVYSCGKYSTPVTLDHQFYVSEVTNYPAKQVEMIIYETFCGQDEGSVNTRLRQAAPDRFYTIYKNTFSGRIH